MDAHAQELLTLTLWLLCGLGTVGLAIMGFGGRKLLDRLDEQDKTLMSIRDLLHSEVRVLREMQHNIETRVVRLEAKVL